DAARQAGALRHGIYREAAHVRARPERAALRRPGRAGDRAQGGREGLRVFGYRRGHRRERAVPDALAARDRGPGRGGKAREALKAKGRRMTFITKKALPRRAFLRGAGAAIALPWLDAMAPAFAADARPAV